MVRLFTFIVIFTLLFSCKKDGETITPDIYFSDLKDGASLWNSPTITVGVANSESIIKVDLFVNDISIASIRKAPFSTVWNTTAMNDGPYVLKASSTDKQGVTKETKIDVIIQNGLLVFEVPANHLASNGGVLDRGWIFISSSISGSLVAVEEMKNGSKFTLRNSDFEDKSFTVSEAYLSNFGTSLLISSYLAVPRGIWTVATEPEEPSIVGQLSVSFKDSLGQHPYYVSTSGDSHLFYDGGNSIKLNANLSPTRLFVRELGKPTNHYNLLEGLSLDQSHYEQFSDLKKPLDLANTSALADATAAGVRLYGFPNKSDFKEYYQLGTFSINGGSVQVEYPGSSFAVYGSENLLGSKNVRMNCFNPAKMFDMNLLKAQVIFKDAGNSGVSVATFGDFDIYAATWGYAEKSIDFTWLITGGQGQSSFLKLPALPSSIRSSGFESFNPDKLAFSSFLQIADYEISKDYASYIDYISHHGYNSPYEFGKAWKEQTFSTSGVTGGGRSSIADLPTIKERLQGSK